jgi:hypothetical protein
LATIKFSLQPFAAMKFPEENFYHYSKMAHRVTVVCLVYKKRHEHRRNSKTDLLQFTDVYFVLLFAVVKLL